MENISFSKYAHSNTERWFLYFYSNAMPLLMIDICSLKNDDYHNIQISHFHFSNAFILWMVNVDEWMPFFLPMWRKFYMKDDIKILINNINFLFEIKFYIKPNDTNRLKFMDWVIKCSCISVRINNKIAVSPLVPRNFDRIFFILSFIRTEFVRFHLMPRKKYLYDDTDMKL